MYLMNKYTYSALSWLAFGIYALILRDGGNNDLPSFPHFDKICHFGLFFIQIWLCAKAFAYSHKPVPYLGLIIFALFYALSSELSQAFFTTTREGSWLDGLADMLGALSALFIIKIYWIYSSTTPNCNSGV